MIKQMLFKGFSKLDEALLFADKLTSADIFKTNSGLFYVIPISEWAEDSELKFIFEDKVIAYRESLEDSRKPAFDKWVSSLPYAFIGGNYCSKKIYTSLGFPKEMKVFFAINKYWKEVNKHVWQQ